MSSLRCCRPVIFQKPTPESLLLPLAMPIPARFAVSAWATGATFLLIGVVKGYVLERPRWRSGLETLLVGGGAAGLAYLVGMWFRTMAGP